MTKIFDNKLNRFVDQATAFPKTHGTAATSAARTQDCGCEPSPTTQKRSSAVDATHRHYTMDNKGFWRIKKVKGA